MMQRGDNARARPNPIFTRAQKLPSSEQRPKRSLKQTNMEIMKLFGKVFSSGAAVSPEKGRSSSDSEREDGTATEAPAEECQVLSKPAAAPVMR